MKTLDDAKKKFAESFICKNGKLKPIYRDAVATIANYKEPLKLKYWSKSYSRYLNLKNEKLYDKIVELLDCMGAEYRHTNISPSGYAKDGDVITITGKGQIRARRIFSHFAI